jgi:hypothetical protein
MRRGSRLVANTVLLAEAARHQYVRRPPYDVLFAMTSAPATHAPSVGDLARRINLTLRALGDGWVEG